MKKKHQLRKKFLLISALSLGICSLSFMTTSCGGNGDPAVMTQSKQISSDCPKNMDVIGILDSIRYDAKSDNVTLYFTEDIKGFCEWLKKSDANRSSCVKYFLTDIKPETFAKAISSAKTRLIFAYPAANYSFEADSDDITGSSMTPMTKFDIAKMLLNLTAEVITLNASTQPDTPAKAEMNDKGFTVYYNTTSANLSQIASDKVWAKKNIHAKLWNSRNDDTTQAMIRDITTIGIPLNLIYQAPGVDKTVTFTFTAKELNAFITD